MSSSSETEREVGYTQKMELIRMCWFWEGRRCAVWRSGDLAGHHAELCDENFSAYCLKISETNSVIISILWTRASS